MVQYSSNTDETEVSITNKSFYPEISITDLKDSYRINSDTKGSLIANALQTAVYDTNTILSEWWQSKTETALQDISDELVHHYKNAVYNKALASIANDYRDTSATKLGHDRADDNDLIADEYNRRAWASVQRILGQTTTRVTLL